MAVLERSFTFGANGETAFPLVRNIRTIAFRAGSFIDSIIINGMAFGGSGGNLTKTLEIDPGDYVSRLIINHGAVIDYIRLDTNDGQTLIAGGDGGHSSVLEGKLTGFSGMTGHFVPGDPLVIGSLTVWIETAQHEPNGQPGR